MQIALPWLAVELTGDALTLGTVSLLSGVTRVSFVLWGGALADRFSPRSLALLAYAARAACLAAFLGLQAVGCMSLAALYAFSLACGASDAVLLPARGSLAPRLVEGRQLRPANALLFGQERAWGIAGPLLAGGLIAALADTSGGVAAALLVALAALCASILILWRVKLPARGGAVPRERAAPSPGASLRELLSMVWRQKSLRGWLGMVYGVNLLSTAPLTIGLPTLAVSRFGNGAGMLGALASACAGGALLGDLLAGLLPIPRQEHFGRVFAAALGGLGLGLAGALVAASPGALLLAALSSAALVGYVNTLGITSLQRETPPAFLGRMMGLVNLK